jgi:FtsP/CotA-like multicopper oxidase with cupredoxin domain
MSLELAYYATCRPTEHPIMATLGTVQEWLVPTVNVHPMHLHVNPVQIIGLPRYTNATVKASYTSYFEPGDWYGPQMQQHCPLCMHKIQ